MEIILSNPDYMYAKNTIKPMAKNMNDFWESIIVSLIGLPPPNSHLKPQASFHHLSTILPTKKKKEKKRKMLPEHANTVKRTERVKKQGMNVCSVPINQHWVLIPVFTCFIRTLVCSKKKHDLIMKMNDLLHNNIFCILEPWYSSDVFKKKEL